jgi:DNA cross-link repair 1B protein
VTLFDANHCAGSVILLIEGYMGTVLYSGDMRFDREVFQEYTYLYPHSKRNKDFKGCSLGVDFLYLDTTFLHPKFSFPPKEAALGQLDSFIDATIKKAKADKQFIEFYIGIDSFGKEEVLVHLAEKFQTLVVVSEDRYKNISTVGLDSELFTTDP